jgi:DNA-binding NtrC family response regulator
LLFRLNTVEIHLPPLRERREDIPLLAGHFLARWSKRYRRLLSGFAPRALEIMMQYAWPGNVRELDHCVERSVLMARSEKVDIGDLNLTPPRSAVASTSLDDMSLEAVESILIRKALARAQGNVSQAAEALGLSRGALYRRMEKYAI